MLLLSFYRGEKYVAERSSILFKVTQNSGSSSRIINFCFLIWWTWGYRMQLGRSKIPVLCHETVMRHELLVFSCPLTWAPLDDFSLSNFPHHGTPDPETKYYIKNQDLWLTESQISCSLVSNQNLLLFNLCFPCCEMAWWTLEKSTGGSGGEPLVNLF